jgi:hypothetical protein
VALATGFATEKAMLSSEYYITSITNVLNRTRIPPNPYRSKESSLFEWGVAK